MTLIEELRTQYASRDKLARIPEKEGAILVSVTTGRRNLAQASLDELERLAHTAGLQVMDKVLQRRKSIDGRFVIGKGRLQQLVIRPCSSIARSWSLTEKLSPSQLRNIATEAEIKVVDRSQLILDILLNGPKAVKVNCRSSSHSCAIENPD